jgi:hypothetical protein
MEHEQRPEYYEPPLEFRDGANGMIIYSLGHVALSNDIGLGGSSSYRIEYYHGKGNVYQRRLEADRSLPETKVFPIKTQHEPGALNEYFFRGTFKGEWIMGYASGKYVDGSFLYGGCSSEARRRQFTKALDRIKTLVRSQMYEDFGLEEEAPRAA